MEIGRWGGEEFVGVLYDKPLDGAIGMAERLRSAIEDSDILAGEKITCSIGVAQVRENDSFEDVFERMDKALYTAKSNGRNKVIAGEEIL